MSGTRKSIMMLSNTGNDLNAVSDRIKADSWFGYTDGLHTVQVTYQQLTGGFGIQGTLSLDPKDEDWFWINLTDYRGNCSPYPFITYPKDPLNPTGASGPEGAATGDTGTEAFTFQGNFTFLKAVLTRDYITPPPQLSGDRYHLGQIDKVLISL